MGYACKLGNNGRTPKINFLTIGGSYNSQNANTVSISPYLPSIYRNLTISNFSLSNVIVQFSTSGVTTSSSNYILGSYNPSNGILYCNASCVYKAGTGRYYGTYGIRVSYLT